MKTSTLGLLVGMSLLTGCGDDTASHRAAGDDAAAAITVAAANVVAEERPSTLEITGTVRATQRAMLAAKLMGAIEAIPVSLGQRVQANDLLVQIAAPEVSARVAQARTQRSTAQRDLERERALLAQGASTTETVRNLEDRVATAEAMLREAEAMLAFSELRAPFDGVIAQKLAHAGDLATPGTPLLEVHGDQAFEIDAAVPESLAAVLEVGGSVEVRLPASDAGFIGTVAEVSSATDVQARAVAVKIAVPPGVPVRSGQFARLQIPGSARPVLLVPATAVSRLGQMERVFVIGDDHRAQLRLVKTGPPSGDTVEILAGMNEGDRVVTAPPTGLRDGQRVEVRP